jgi:hypothetical protein
MEGIAREGTMLRSNPAPRMAILALVLGTAAGGVARADDPACWSAGAGGWPPVRAGSLLVFAGDGALTARRPDGTIRWRHRRSALAGPVSLAGDERRVVALTTEGWIALDAADGRLLWRRALARTRDLLRGIDGAHGLLYRELDGKSPKRLVVVELSTGNEIYEFKLLARGEHQVVRFADGRLAFVDGRVGRGGKRRLYYVEVALPDGRRVHDFDLTKLVAGSRAKVQAARGAEGRLVVAASGDAPLVLGIDLERRRVLWKRRDLAARALHWQDGALVAAAAGPLTWLDPATGKTLRAEPVQGTIQGLVAGPGCWLLRTTRCLRCVPSGERVSSTSPPPTTGGPASRPAVADRPTPPPGAPAIAGARPYVDRHGRFRLTLPRGWQAMRRYARPFGRGRYSLPLARYRRSPLGWRIEASVNVLVREAVEPSAEQLWQTILAFRQRRDPGLRVLGLVRRQQQGHPVLVATYLVRGEHGRPERVRSLCLVAGGRAYELRGRARDETGWAEVAQLLASFSPS